MIHSLSLQNSVAAATEKGDADSQSDEEDDEIATPAFNIDKLKAETKTPFRTVSAAVVSANISRVCGEGHSSADLPVLARL